MTTSLRNVLFVCTGNSARSIMAEGILNQIGGARFDAYSAGSQPTGVVNPTALEVLSRWRIPTDGFRSKSWLEFTTPGAPALQFVFTVCDRAAGETCPVWPGQPVTAHWGVPDPAAFEGREDQRLQCFLDVAVTLKRRIELMLALPIEKLDALSLRNAVRDIGQQ